MHHLLPDGVKPPRILSDHELHLMFQTDNPQVWKHIRTRQLSGEVLTDQGWHRLSGPHYFGTFHSEYGWLNRADTPDWRQAFKGGGCE
jgi:hypothetical protein